MNNLIAPEIVNDDFAVALEHLVARQPVKSILELGASAGDGSTACFMRGMHVNTEARLYSLEASKERFAELQKRYNNRARITCINAFSVPFEQWLTPAIIDRLVLPFGCEFGGDDFKRWLKQEQDYLAESGVATNGIEQAMTLNGGPFDLVLIDSSLFTGSAELDAVYGSSFIALDDVRSMKNGLNHVRLKNDPTYRLLANGSTRYGWAIYGRL